MSHGGPWRNSDDLDETFARVVADTMQALATPSRLRILGRLHMGPCSVSELAHHVGMEASAVSATAAACVASTATTAKSRMLAHNSAGPKNVLTDA